MARPTIAPLDSAAELAAVRHITTALVHGRWRAGSWTDAEGQALALIAQLRGEGIELVNVGWS
jgi:hypothetical protein